MAVPADDLRFVPGLILAIQHPRVTPAPSYPMISAGFQMYLYPHALVTHRHTSMHMILINN